jgi:hypothetical protein
MMIVHHAAKKVHDFHRVYQRFVSKNVKGIEEKDAVVIPPPSFLLMVALRFEYVVLFAVPDAKDAVSERSDASKGASLFKLLSRWGGP